MVREESPPTPPLSAIIFNAEWLKLTNYEDIQAPLSVVRHILFGG
jgi:hypothetical protein